MTPIFRPGPGPYALALAMTGIKMGERLLEIGAGTPALFGALASKVGISGRAAAIVERETQGAALEAAGADVGALVEVQVAAAGSRLPFEAEAFDLVVVDATTEPPDRSASWLGEAMRVLRAGGRLIVAERSATGLRAMLPGGRSHSGASRDAAAILADHDFRPVRKIAERSGWKFTEGMKPGLRNSEL